MNRRLFCQIPLFASALIAESATAKPPQDPRATKGFKVDGDKGRLGEELLMMGGQFRLKVSAKDTGGQLCIYDTTRKEKGGPGLHRHFHQDEWFYVMSGEFVIRVGDDLLHLKPGDSAFAPRQIPHTFSKVGDDPGHVMILFQPAGSMEDFFRQVSKLGASIPKGQEAALKDLFHTHGMELLGPPLQV